MEVGLIRQSVCHKVSGFLPINILFYNISFSCSCLILPIVEIQGCCCYWCPTERKTNWFRQRTFELLHRSWVITVPQGRHILLSCVCLFNTKLGFLRGIIKSVLMYYLCMQPLHYSNNTFAHYCIFVETQELVRLPLLNSKTFSPKPLPRCHLLLIYPPPPPKRSTEVI